MLILKKILSLKIFIFIFFLQSCQTGLVSFGTSDLKTYYANNITNPLNKIKISRELSDIDDDVLCFNATKTLGDKKYWHHLNENYIKEAKYRGLKCGVEEKNQLVFNTDYVRINLSSEKICKLATLKKVDGKIVWNLKHFPYHVMEARYRNLNCGVADVDRNINSVSIESKKIIDADELFFKSLRLKSDEVICSIVSVKANSKGRSLYLKEAKRRGLNCGINVENKIDEVAETKTNELNKKSFSSKSIQERDNRIKELEDQIAVLKTKKKKYNYKVEENEIGSGFYVSKFRHIVTNQHVVNKCNKITVGDSMNTQIPADLIASDRRNDLAILQTISMESASADTKSFIQNLSIQIVPIVSGGLIRAEDVIGGEEIFVAGYPLGNMVSDSMRLVPGLVNATKGYKNDITQFETDASIKKGNSGGPIYDKRGNIVGVAVKRLNVSQSDNFNFAIKGTTVKQFLDANGVITSLANRKSQMSSIDIYKIASKQTLMVVCYR